MRPLQLSGLAALALAASALPGRAQDVPPSDMTPAAAVATAAAQELPLQGTRYYAQPPQFAYPVAALRAAIEGRCMIAFTIDAQGVPQDIQPDCDHPLFTAPAHEGAARLRMKVGGDVAPGKRFVLPVSFRIPL